MSEEGLYGEGKIMVICFDRWTWVYGESITTRPWFDVRGENRGKLSGSTEPCLVVFPDFIPAGLEEMVC